MENNKKKIFCQNCGTDLLGKNHIVTFENIFFNTKFFCSKRCKKDWLKNSHYNERGLDENYIIRKAKEKALEIKTLYNELGPRNIQNNGRWKKNKNPNLQLTSVYHSSRSLDEIELLVLFGLYKDRSEAIRHYVNEGLKRDLHEFEFLDKIINYDINNLQLLIASKINEKSKFLKNLENITVKDSDGSFHEYKIIKVIEEVDKVE